LDDCVLKFLFSREKKRMESLENNVSFILVYDPKKGNKIGENNYVIVGREELIAYGSYCLLILDYFAVYVPQIWLERFHYLKNIFHHEKKGWAKSDSLIRQNQLKMVDLSADLHQCLYKTDEMMDFSLFPDMLFAMFQGHSSSFLSTKQRRVIRFLIPFVEFLAPSTSEVEYWRKKSQSYFLITDMDLS